MKIARNAFAGFVALIMMATSTLVTSKTVLWDYEKANVEVVNFGTPDFNSYGRPAVLGDTNSVRYWKAMWTDQATDWCLYWPSPQQNFQTGFSTDFDAIKTWTAAEMGKTDSYGAITEFRLKSTMDGEKWTVVDLTGSDVDSGKCNGGRGDAADCTITSNLAIKDAKAGVFAVGFTSPRDRPWYNKVTFGKPFAARSIRMEIGKWTDQQGNANCGWNRWRWWYDSDDPHLSTVTTTTLTTVTATTVTTTTATTTTTTTTTVTTVTATKTSTTTDTVSTVTSTTVTKPTTTSATQTTRTKTTETTTTKLPEWYRKVLENDFNKVAIPSIDVPVDGILRISPGNKGVVVVDGPQHIRGTLTINSKDGKQPNINVALALDRCAQHARDQTDELKELKAILLALKKEVAVLKKKL